MWEGNESFSKVDLYIPAPSKCPSHRWIPGKFVKDEDEIVLFSHEFSPWLALINNTIQCVKEINW